MGFKKNDIFLITGASSGIGRATALKLVELGASVIISGRNQQKLEEVRKEASNSQCVYIEIKELLDDINGLSEWVKDLSKKYGKLKGLFPFAGVRHIRPVSIIDYQSSVEIMNLHYFVPLMLIKGFSDRRVNTGENCSIIIMSSIGRYLGTKGQSEYAAAKAAVAALARNLANEFYSKNIRVNSISPGLVYTPAFSNAQDNAEITISHSVDKLCGKPDDIANLAAFLASDDARWINGEDIVIDGGTTLPSIFQQNISGSD